KRPLKAAVAASDSGVRRPLAGRRPSIPQAQQENPMNQMTSFDPFADTGFDEIFRGFFQPVRSTSSQARAMAIKMDVKENGDGYVVHAEIPGVKKDDIHVTIEGNQVTIGAETRRETEQKDGERVLRSERFYGDLYRSFALPV